MTLSYETRLIAALYALKLPGSADRIAAAAGARNEREALFHVESAELLQARHAKTPFTALLTDSRATVAVTAGRQAVLLLPIDWLRWTDDVSVVLSDLGDRARQDLRATSLLIVLTGKTSDLGAKELAAKGWKVTAG